MAVTNIKVSLPIDIKTVWEIVTSLNSYTWRSDISKIEIIEPHKKFIEYTYNNYPTTFTITVYEQYHRYEFDMENNNMKGHWTGLFTYHNGITTIDFTEDVIAKKIYMKPLVKSYLKKQQTIYLNDLKKALEIIQ